MRETEFPTICVADGFIQTDNGAKVFAATDD